MISPPRLHCRVERRSPHSFQADSPAAVVELLRQHGYTAINVRSPHEHARLVQGGALAVIYLSGSVVAQGADPQPLLALLEAEGER